MTLGTSGSVERRPQAGSIFPGYGPAHRIQLHEINPGLVKKGLQVLTQSGQSSPGSCISHTRPGVVLGRNRSRVHDHAQGETGHC